MRRNVSVIICLAIVLVTFLPLQGCQTPEPVRMPVTPSLSAAETPSASAAATAAATTTPLPLTPLPPRLLATVPQKGAAHRPTDPITLQFDQAMDRGSVEKSLVVEPDTEGQIVWIDDATITFLPDASFERDTHYRVSIKSAASATGVPASDDVVLEFDTVGYLRVTQVSPVHDSTDVSTDTPIQVVFNRPVVPLTSVRRQEALADPLTIVPPVEGEGRWVNTSIYVFEPSEGLVPGTQYVAAISGGLVDTTGGVLQEDFVWSFVTERPRLADVHPFDGQNYVPVDTNVTLTFSQAMDRKATEERFALLDIDQSPVSGHITWDGTALTFSPSQPLTPGGVYLVRLDSGAPAATGDSSIDGGYFGQFTVIEPPTVIRFEPQGENVAPYEGLQITFSSPISTETLIEGLLVTPTVQTYGTWPQEETTYYVATNLQPSTVYTVTLTTDILGRDGDRLAEPYTTTLRTRALSPSFRLDVPSRVGSYNAYGTPTIRVEATNVNSLEISLYRISTERFLWLNGTGSWQTWRDFVPDKGDLVRRWARFPEAPLNETTTLLQELTTETGDVLGPGLYYVEIRSPQVTDYRYQHVLVVSSLNVTIKSTTTEALAWVTDLRDGVPVAGVPITFYGEYGNEIGSGMTDDDGVAIVTYSGEPLEPWDSMFAVTTYQDVATVHMGNWSRGLQAWDFGLPYSPYDEEYRSHLYTDRQIYRPDQTVYYKGVVRLDDDGTYALPDAGQTVTITVLDSEYREVWKEIVPLGDMGTVSGEFHLSKEASLGYYTLRAELGDASFGSQFDVAEYRKPEFEATVLVDRPEYVQGDTITAEVEARYYSGGPVANARVRWTVTSTPYFFDRWTGKDYYTFWDYDYDEHGRYVPSGMILTEGTGRTNADGRYVMNIPVELSERTQSQVYVIETTVIDASNQAVSARASAIAHKGDIYIGLLPVGYLGTSGERHDVTVITVDTQGITVTEQTVDILVLREEWYSVKEEAEDGAFYWTSRVRHTPVVTDTVTTDDAGVAVATFVPSEGGAYKVLASSLDAAENRVQSAAYVWVSDYHYVNWGQRNDDTIDLVSDKDFYRPGDTASILIPSPYEGEVTALLTIERGKILEHRLLLLSSNSEQIEIPVKANYAPNVYVSVMIVKGMDQNTRVPGFKAGYVTLNVSTEQRELSVTITPESDGPFQPREKVTLDVDVHDYRGRGVKAEVSLKLVDRAVEALTGGDSLSITDAFYGERALGVRTAATLAVSVDRHVLLTSSEAKGGGGADGAAPFVRTEFPDTAFWAPEVLTDQDGHATLTVTLPDNLTAWHMVAQAVTADTLVGTGEIDLISTMDLLIRPIAPRFLVVGDEPLLGAVLHNNTDAALDAKVTLDADGALLLSNEENVRIPAGGQATVEFPAVVDGPNGVTLHYEAFGDGHTDAIEISIPVMIPSSPEVVATSGQVANSVLELARLPLNVDPSQGELRVTLETSLAAGMTEGLKYLESYPYECVEQTVSRFLPNVVTLSALQTLGMSRPDLEQKLPGLVTTALQRLYAAQNMDGGWGWWPSQESSPLITTYVLLGMSEARASGFSVDSGVLDRAAQYLFKWLDAHPMRDGDDLDLRATVLYALSEAGEGDLGRTVTLYDARHDLSLYAQAFLAMTLQVMTPQETSRLDTLLNEFAAQAIFSGTGVHWEEEIPSPWSMNTDLRTTALVLRAMVRLDPDNSLLPNAVRWLMSVRREGRWESTQDNVWSILALTDYMLASGDPTPHYDYALWVNGVEQTSGHATSEDADTSVTVNVPISELHVLGDNQVLLERGVGSGNLYYSIYMQYYLPAEKMLPLDRGVIVQREYRDGDAPSQILEGSRAQDTVLVRLTVIVPYDLHYVVLEDPLPAGCEAIDPRLATTAQTTPVPMLQMEGIPYLHRNWAKHTEFRDEKVVLFADFLPEGTYEYVYSMRCTTPGEYQVLPTTAYEMYQPDVFGRSAGLSFSIAPTP